MGFFDSLMGRSTPPAPDLDNLFGLPAAAVTLRPPWDSAHRNRLGGLPGTGGQAFGEVQREIEELVSTDAPVEVGNDEFGYTWITLRAADIATLVTDLHAVNTSLVDAGFGPTLLCTLVGFLDDRGRRLGLVYLFKQGTFYPFVPEDDATGSQRRDNIVELQVRDLVADDLRVEPELTRWFALWGAPGLG